MSNIVTVADVISALNMNGVDESQYYDVDEWDDVVNDCLSIIDNNIIDDNISEGELLDCVEEQLAFAGKI